jgi:two-component system response regulator AtoC
VNPTVLIIDDEKTIRTSLSFFFNGKGYETHQAGSAEEGLRLTREFQPDLIILDHNLPDKTGLEALSGIKAAQPDTTVIILTAYASISGAVDAIRAGAFDYLTKPVDLDTLEIVSDRAVEMRVLKKENLLLRKLQSAAQREGVIGNSPEVHKLHLMINLLAENPNTTVLIEGESGTGKELAAKTIHNLSIRRERPFVDINCASLSENLLESELFGHEKGAFTDAKNMKQGLLEIADGGTLFLDEIGDLSLSLQPKLLRVLETKTFRRVGGTRDIKVEVRVIAATNKNLQEAVSEKKFRDDLYYRLRVMPLYMPPLKDRGTDILVLARHFLSQMTQAIKKQIKGISPECEKHLLNYTWPGNIRELRNVVERAVIISGGPYITPEHLPRELTEPEPPAPASMDDETPATLDFVERRHIEDVMKKTAGNQSQAARILGISRSTLISKLKKFNLL